MSIQFTQLGIRASKASRILPTPLYNTLSNIELILDATGLRNNTTNSYGVCNSSFVCTQWNSIAPGPTGRDFAVTGSGSAFKVTDSYINFAGAARLTDANSANYNFMSYNAVVANLKWTVHMVLKIGNESDPNWLYPIMGNNGASAGNKGISIIFEDRSAISRSNGLSTSISKGSAGFILTGAPDNLITPNTPFVLTIETDMSQAAADRQKYYINGVQFAHTVISTSTAVVTSPTYDLDLGAAGNSVFGFFGWMSHVIIQSGLESSGVRTAFINSLLPYTLGKSTQFYQTDEALRFNIFSTIDETTKYYLCTGLDQKPGSPSTLLKCIVRGDQHTPDSTKKIVMYKSTDRGGTFAAPVDILDPAGTLCVQDAGFGYSSNGRHHGFADQHDISAGVAVAPHTVQYFYTDDDYATAPTVVDITAAVPSDGLVAFRMYGNLIDNNGVLMFPYYKATDEGVTTNSANYIFRSTDGGANWTTVTVRASASTYINEGTIIALDNSNLIMVCRNDTSLEYTFFYSTDNGLNWTNDGDFAPSTHTIAAPGRLVRFMMEGQLVIGFIWSNKGAKTLEGIFGIATTIASSHKTGFISGTKVTLVSNADAGNRFYHYGTPVAFKNDFNFIAAYAREPVVVTNTENSNVTFIMPSDGYLTVKTALGL